jgi:predicted Zn-dependent protease
MGSPDFATRLFHSACRATRSGGALAGCFGLLLFATPLPAHGDDQRLLDALAEEIERAPTAELHLRRGELYRHHREWFKAEADFIAARRLDPSLTVVDYFRARLLLEAGTPEKARPFLERYLGTAPEEPEAWFLRGEIAAAFHEGAAAAEHYAQGIRFSAHPRAEHYVRRARLLLSLPDSGPGLALGAIEEGIARLGQAAALVELAIEIDLRTADYPAALARIGRALQSMPRRERWLARQGDLLTLAGRIPDAIAAYRAALAAIDALPERYRDTVPTEKLAADTRAALARLAAPAASTP